MNNDTLLIDEIKKKQKNESGKSKGDLFEFIAFQQFLKSFDLTEAEVEKGVTDGADDGGIDGIYIFINGNPFNSNIMPKRDISIDVVIFTAKHADTFELHPLESVHSSITELLDFSISDENLKSTFNTRILKKRNELKSVLFHDPANRSRFSVQFAYISRGDVKNVGYNIKSKSESIVGITRELIRDSDVTFTFVGAKELLTMLRKNYKTSNLKYSSYLREKDSFLVLTNLDHYFDFISDKEGRIKRYLFEENVRDFLGENRVNLGITESLENELDVDFWNLNNGITIIADHVHQMSDNFQLENAKIVNGLQTTHAIFNYFKSKDSVTRDDRKIMIKLISETNSIDRNKIIISTNNQSLVQPYSLRANDSFQIAIDEYFEPKGLYYERRNKYYLNLGKDRKRIVNPLYTARVICALIKKQPYVSSRLKQKFMNDDYAYRVIFDSDISLEHIYHAVELCKSIETELLRLNVRDTLNLFGLNKENGQQLKTNNFIGIFPLLYVSLYKGTFKYKMSDICDLAINPIDSDIIMKIADSIDELASTGKLMKEKKISKHQIDIILEKIATEYNIVALESVTMRKPILSIYELTGMNYDLANIPKVEMVIEDKNYTDINAK
ncbi:AIPR family protein [Erysipelothrix aquatica]|uniref:AIPR family protein n=2 Tax=Erysipelothrix aquatica TaxID=2683714 RepID=UPI00135A4E13|nr:AIPR family protein [Erysipelothrix aquatica]